MGMDASRELREPHRFILGSKFCHFSSEHDCPSGTIKMVPKAQVEGHDTSIESQPNREHPVFENLKVLPEEVRKPLENPAPAETPA